MFQDGLLQYFVLAEYSYSSVLLKLKAMSSDDTADVLIF